jgi:membrane protease subunit HflC
MTRLLLITLLLLLWLSSCLYTVDQAEYAYVTQFGRPVATLDGAADAGLHVKLPWPAESVQRIDRRLQAFDLPAVESLTRDPAAKTVDKTLAVDAFVTWRIPDAAAADRFVRTVGTAEQAKRVLGPRISGRLASVISNMPLDDLIAVADEKGIDARSEKLRRQLLGEGTGEDLRERVRADYGMELVDLRLRRFSYPEAVRASIAERIRSERARKVADYESDARRRAADITTDADRVARTLEADARARRTEVEGSANAEAGRLRSSAYAQDREFYVFLEKLRSFQAMLADTRDVLLLSTRHPLFDLLLGPPVSGGVQPRRSPPATGRACG